MAHKYDNNFFSAYICLHGHIVSSYGEFDGSYCKECGSHILHHCPNCLSFIRGRSANSFQKNYKIPNYCIHCGHAFPWTIETKESLNELLKLNSGFSSEDINFVDKNFNSLIVDTPKTKLLATKLHIMLSEATPVVVEASKGLLVDVISETAKKIMFPGL